MRNMNNPHVANIVNKYSPMFNLEMQDYVRTPEDEEKDRREAAWKQQRNQEALKSFLKRNPDGRVISRS